MVPCALRVHGPCVALHRGMTTTRPRAGLNGNFHATCAPEEALLAAGVRYLGGGEWSLPAGAEISGGEQDEWTLTLADGSEWQVWSEA